MALNPLVQSLIGAEGLIAPQKPKDLFASLLIKNGLSTEPVGHWTQGAARMAQALLGGLELRGQDSDEKARQAAPDEIARAVGIGGITPQSQPQQPMQRPLPTPSVAGNLPASPPPNDPTMTVSPRQVAMANTLQPSFNDRFSAAFPAQPNARPVQTVPQQSSPTAAPDLMGAAQEMRRSTNPYVKAYGTQIMLQEITRSPEFEIKTENGVTIAVDKRNPRNRHIIDDPEMAQALIQRKAQEQYATTFSGEQAKRDIARPQQQEQMRRYGNIAIEDIDRGLDMIAKQTTLSPITGMTGSLASNVPGQPAHDFSKLMTSVASHASLSKLQEMREASPTGGALGNVTEKELDILKGALGDLSQSQTAEQLTYNLRRVKNTYLDIIHGPGQGPRREALSGTPTAPSGGQQRTNSGRTSSGVGWRLD